MSSSAPSLPSSAPMGSRCASAASWRSSRSALAVATSPSATSTPIPTPTSAPPADRRSDPHHGDRPGFASVTIIQPVRDPTRQCERQQPENPHHLLVREPALAHLALRLGCRRGRVSRLDWSVKRRAGHHAHPRDEARITQGSIVENKHLADTLQWVAEQQRQRDRDRLTKPKISLREKNRIRMAANLTT